jgi:hypothetical protein
MGLANSVPMDSSLGCTLKYWECSDPANLKKEHLIHYSNEVLPQYLLGTKRWCENGSQRWPEILYMQAFMVLYQNPTLYKGLSRPQQKCKERDIDILNDPLL